MKDQLSSVSQKRLFVVISLFFVIMTVALTVLQVRQTQDLRSSAAGTNCQVGNFELGFDGEEQQMLTLINDFRSSNGLSEVGLEDELHAAATWHSKDMATRNVLDHTDSLGRNPFARVKDCSYKTTNNFGENIGVGPTTQQIFDGWKNSPGHKAIILCAECRDLGIARHFHSDNRWFWTLDIDAPKDEDENENEPTKPPPSKSPSPTDPEGTPTPTPTPEVTLPPAKTELPDGTTGIYASVAMSGIASSGNPEPRHPNRPLTVTVFDSDDKELAKAEGIVSYDPTEEVFFGAIELPTSLESGTYIIKVKTDKSITRTVFSGFLKIEKGKAVELPLVTLPTVDLDDNNAITFADVNVFKGCLASKKCTRFETDLDDNGEVDIFDYIVFYDVFGNYEGE